MLTLVASTDQNTFHACVYVVHACLYVQTALKLSKVFCILVTHGMTITQPCLCVCGHVQIPRKVFLYALFMRNVQHDCWPFLTFGWTLLMAYHIMWNNCFLLLLCADQTGGDTSLQVCIVYTYQLMCLGYPLFVRYTGVVYIVWDVLLAHRVSYCTVDPYYDKVFCYISRNHENKKLECHAFLCSKKSKVRKEDCFMR